MSEWGNYPNYAPVPDRVSDAPDEDQVSWLKKMALDFEEKLTAAESTVARLEAEKQAAHTEGWISVEDRLPDRVNHCSAIVLGWKPETRVHPMYYNFAAAEWRLYKDDLPVKPTHWMPMPAKPTAAKPEPSPSSAKQGEPS